MCPAGEHPNKERALRLDKKLIAVYNEQNVHMEKKKRRALVPGLILNMDSG